MSISPSSLQILSSLSLVPSSLSSAVGNSASPAQLNQIASLNSQLSIEETLFGQPATTSSSAAPPDVEDSVDLSGATLTSLGGTPASSSLTPATSTSSTPTSTGISLLG